MMGDLERAKIVITNYHAFKLRECMELSKGGRLLLQGAKTPRKRNTMDTYRVPGVNHLKQYGRWAFAVFTEVYQIEAEFHKMIDRLMQGENAP